ncbi:3'(2'),5'-bisphosphate nucleotidase CysQ [Pseudoblastomonas halimionae]|uniref:3'(2'),5'-bisphosphate nucleotidase CysQ n=1 Tax=Alteriqipengyuania halimionae TaxID=1926630 RepID=A0A6I4U3H4_9SPHN|nr:3'(2'),5'-bisphosphate nucleotidase CysQ [Alteriqipengyuania halimionae]MXP08991.1 3'(2'),5'-bisphosphate nucleotidase CysQ [Alteriqipengyuania halimionae]
MSDTARTDAELAAAIAEEAGDLLRVLQTSGESSGRELGDIGDRRADELILARLRVSRPDDCILSEESADIGDRHCSTRVWVIDPLDGTRSYCEGSPQWSVHIALVEDGVPTHGAVALPTLGETWRSDQPVKLTPAHDSPRIVVSGSRTPAEAPALAEALGGELIKMGSAGYKAMAVLRGDADIYYHSGGQHEWDNCAPAAVALASGLHCSRIDGAPFRYNCKDTLVPDLLFTHPAWADRALEAISGLEIERS